MYKLLALHVNSAFFFLLSIFPHSLSPLRHGTSIYQWGPPHAQRQTPLSASSTSSPCGMRGSIGVKRGDEIAYPGCDAGKVQWRIAWRALPKAAAIHPVLLSPNTSFVRLIRSPAWPSLHEHVVCGGSQRCREILVNGEHCARCVGWCSRVKGGRGVAC